MIEDESIERVEIEYPESPNLDFENAKQFFVVGNEYINDCVQVFIDRPEWNVDDQGRTYWMTRLKKGGEYFGMRIPDFIASKIGFPDFDGSRSLVKIHENPVTFFKKFGFSLADGHLVVL